MNPKRLLPCLAAILLASPLAFGDTIAKWTFETSQPGVVTLPAQPGAGNWLTNIVAETPAGTAAGWHAGATTYSSPAGNGSSHSFSSTVWAVGDFYQFAVRSIGFQNLSVSFDIAKSSTGPGSVVLQYSTDGSTFNQFGSAFNVLTNGTGAPSWNSTTASSAYTVSFDLSSITALNNAAIVYIRLVAATAPTSSVGALRVDNFLVSATTIPGFPSITTQPQTNTVVYWGDTAYLNVVASGTAPLTYQWFYPNMSSPLSDGSSGYGVGTISGSTTNTLVLAYVNTNQAGNYQVVVGNYLGYVTSQVARLTVNVRTPIVTNIAYVRSLLDHTTWLPTDTTNLYSVTGVVTTPFNLSGTGNSTEFFMQDGAAGICVFMGGTYGASLPNSGDLVRVTGPVANYYGLLEFNLSASNPSHSISSAISTGNPLPALKYFDINNYSNIPYMETNVEGSLVVVSNVFLDQSSLQFASGAMNITNVNRKYISLYVNANSDVFGQNVPAIAASIAGVMGQYTSTVPATNGYEMYILRYSDLVPTTQVPPMPLQIQGTPTNVVVSWWAVAPFTLQAAPGVTGTYTNIDGATTPFTNGVDSAVKFYRLKQN
jgi:hypothetical protein